MSIGYRILIYQPDAASGQALMSMLAGTPCTFVCCDTSGAASAALDDGETDIAVIFLSPDGPGADMPDRMCETAAAIPWLVATPREAIDTRIAALDRGAVDYLIWPFTAEELVARVSTVLRRRESSPGRFIRRGDIVLDREIGRIGDGMTWTTLSPTERKVFPLLFGDLDRPVSKQRLKRAMAGAAGVSDNAIEALISRLRIKANTWGMRIQTYRGLGYILESL
jgi:two-component system OmpR family response regulator